MKVMSDDLLDDENDYKPARSEYRRCADMLWLIHELNSLCVKSMTELKWNTKWRRLISFKGHQQRIAVAMMLAEKILEAEEYDQVREVPNADSHALEIQSALSGAISLARVMLMALKP